MKNKFLLSILALSLITSCSSDPEIKYTDSSNTILAASNDISKIQLDTALGEKLDPNEESGTAKIQKDILTTLKNNTKQPPTLRVLHAKHHGVVKAIFKIDNSLLPVENRVGVFSENGKEYKAWIRYSNGSGNAKADSEADVRGMGIKLMGVNGSKLLEDEQNATTQDFLMINTKSFFIKDLDTYVKFIEASKNGLKSLVPFALTHPKTTYNIYKIVTQNVANPLETAFYSTTPYKLGKSVIKFGAKPCTGENKEKPKNPTENYLRESMVKTLSQKDVCYDFMVQVRKGSLNDMPVEDSTKEWSEKESPYIKVATINIPKQTFDSKKQMDFAENMSYTPWHSLAEHKPLSFTNRVRKTVYNALSKYRHAQNNTVSREPVDFNY